MKSLFKNIKNKRKLVLLVLDLGCILFSSFFCYYLIYTVLGKQPVTNWALYPKYLCIPSFFLFILVMSIVYVTTLYIYELYDIRNVQRKTYTLIVMLIASVLSVVIYLLLSRVFHVPFSDKKVYLLFWVVITGIVIVARAVFFKFVILPKKKKTNVLFIETDVLTKDLMHEIKGSDYDAIGLLAENCMSIGQYKEGLKVVSTGKNLENLITAKKIKILILALNNRISLPVIKKIYKYKFKGVEFYGSSHFYEIISRKYAIKPYLEDHANPFPNLDAFINPFFKNIKRFLDFCIALFCLVALSPLFLLFAILIKSTSKGAIFYLQERIGFQEKPFKLIKFRTMFIDAEKENGPQWASKNDLRVTKLGKVLRKTRLDELPQCINILRGEMSFVGPRSFRRHFVDIFEEKIPFYSLKFSIKPGLTGWAQVNHYYKNDKQTLQDNVERLQYDLYYIKNASLFFDIFIIVKTLQTLICKPAY